MVLTRAIFDTESNEFIIFAEDKILDMSVIYNLLNTIFGFDIHVDWLNAIPSLCGFDSVLVLQFISVLFK